jgi:hypothetical protein
MRRTAAAEGRRLLHVLLIWLGALPAEADGRFVVRMNTRNRHSRRHRFRMDLYGYARFGNKCGKVVSALPSSNGGK